MRKVDAQSDSCRHLIRRTVGPTEQRYCRRRASMPGGLPHSRPGPILTNMSYSRWILADLHVHTPLDRCHKYGDVGGPEPNEDFATRLIQAHADAGVRIIAVTDHNSLEWYPYLLAAGESLGVAVFPGLEFNVNKCHVLTLWDRTERGYMLANQFLGDLFDPGVQVLTQNRTPSPVTKRSLLTAIRRASTEFEALVFAPHSTANNMGLFGRGVCNTSSDVAQSGYITGFDVHGNSTAEVLRNPRTEFGDKKPTWFVSGDVRSLEDAGKRAIYLKVSNDPTLESIRQAFLMPDRRIRFQETQRENYERVQGIRFLDSPEPTWPHIERLAIAGGFHDGFDVRFGPGLNAIIGGKGTGKSTLIEILRHVVGGNAPVNSEARETLNKNLPANAEGRLRVLASDYERYEIVRPGGDTAARLFRNGSQISVDPSLRFSASIYGQRELSSIPDSQDALREFLAASTDERYKKAVDACRSLLGEINRIDLSMETLEADLSGVSDKEERLQDLRHQLELASEKGGAEAVERSNSLSVAMQQMAVLEQWPRKISGACDRLSEAGNAPTVDAHGTIGHGVKELARTFSDEVQQAVGKARQSIAEFEGNFAGHLDMHRSLADDARQSINAQLAAAGLTDPDDLAKKQRESAELESRLAAVPGKRAELRGFAEQRTALLEQLSDVRREASRHLEAAARSLTSQAGGRVKVSVTPLADRAPFDKLLRDRLAGQNIRGNQIAALAAMSPLSLCGHIRNGSVADIDVSPSTADKIQKVSEKDIRSIEECEVPDHVDVALNLSSDEDPDWHSLKSVSPGQRATAMLSLVLAQGTEPLIIDQPEDDLDNRYIYEQVVQVISRVSDGRQIIVATHNANIPILADAELVVALRASADRGEIIACAGLDDPEVAEQARAILEGGDEAFQARARRYRASK